jgi:transcription initiation factor TFIID subunit 3
VILKINHLRMTMEEEGGRPLREISSVIMTTSGFLSPAREGKLPETKAPAIPSEYLDHPKPAPAPPSAASSTSGSSKSDKKKSGGTKNAPKKKEPPAKKKEIKVIS